MAVIGIIGAEAIVELATEVLRLIRERREGLTQEEIRREEIIAWAIWKPILWAFLPPETKKQIEDLERESSDIKPVNPASKE